MFKKTRMLTVVGAAAGAIALAAPMAIAGPTGTWSLTPTGTFTGTAGVTTLTDNNGNPIECATATADGIAPPTSVGNLATITSASFNAPCTGPFGSDWNVVPHTPWGLNGTSYAAGAGTNGTGQTTGYISDIGATVSGTSILGPCTFEVTGQVDATYNNPSAGGADGTLVVAPATTGPRVLTISNKVGNGCGIVGTSATFVGTYTVVHTSGVSPVISYTP